MSALIFLLRSASCLRTTFADNQKTQANVPVGKHPVDDINKEGFTTVIKKRRTFCQNLEKHNTPYFPY